MGMNFIILIKYFYFNKDIKYWIYSIEMHYRAVLLVLASDNHPIFKNARKIWKKYMHLDPTLKVYFVYGQLQGTLEDFDATSDLVYPDIAESYPVLIEKTVRAMEHIDKQVTYDYFIRTNLSTFWDFQKLHMHLNELPVFGCYSGDGPLPGYTKQGWYLSGTDTIVTPEMVKTMIHNKHLIDYQLVEDAAMGKFFHGILRAPMLPNRICFFEDIVSIDENEKIDHRITLAIQTHKDHYRVKTQSYLREEIDLYIYKCLLKRIYNINS